MQQEETGHRGLTEALGRAGCDRLCTLERLLCGGPSRRQLEKIKQKRSWDLGQGGCHVLEM